MADMPNITVSGIQIFFGDRDFNPVCLCIVDSIFSGLDIPDPPGRNDLQLRRQRLNCQFKPNLVIALSGCAVTDGNSAFFFSDFNQTACNNRAGMRSTKQVFSLIYRPGL